LLQLRVFSGTKGYRTCPRMRALFWPNGRVCWEVNSYLISLRKRRRTISTVNTYCSELSIFVRFLGLRRISFASVTDDTMVAFSEYLQEGDVRNGSHINRLLSRAIKFLDWLQWRLPGDRLVGLDGESAAITIERVLVRRRANSFAQAGFRHHSFVAASVAKVVRPMSPPLIRRLFNAISQSRNRSFIRARNMAMLKLLEGSGIRREELVYATIEGIRGAEVNRNLLTVRTSKREGNPFRSVPVPPVTLRALVQYLDIQRAVLTDKLKKDGKTDAGWAFCTQTGEQMAAATVTQMFAKWRKIAGVKEPAAAHMLRHRWITLQLAQLVRAIGPNTPLSKELLITCLTKLSSKSGHANIAGMLHYVDFAYEELGLPEHKLEDDKRQRGWQAGLATLDQLICAADNAQDSAGGDLLRSLRQIFESLEPSAPAQLGVAAHSLIGN
jgi:site-specific recombinase XerD